MWSNTISDNLSKQVAEFISQNRLLDKNDKCIFALSGGADSVALLLLMCSLGYNVEAAHCNFHLRGEESNRDEQFCVDLCKRIAVPLHLIHFDTYEYANLHKVSIEMAARDLRYSYFEQLRKDIEAQAICVAHHKDDNVETILLNLLRGTGINGLTGISPKNGNIIRPLLCISRDDIIKFLQSINQDYVTDSSNLIDDVQRNKIRLNVLPLLQTVNPAVKSNVLTMARWASEGLKIINQSLSDAVADSFSQGDIDTIDIEKVEKFSSPEYLLWYILSKYGFKSSQIIQIVNNLHSVSGTTWLSNTHELVLDRGKLLLLPIENNESKLMSMPETGIYVYSDKCKIKIESKEISENYTISRINSKICLAADKVKFPLVLRPVSQGDRFVPFGMKGSKLVSDFLTNQKVALPIKRRQLVVTDALNNILWVVGRRIDGRYCVNKQTSAVIEISLLS